jgi:hypothetical protein
VSAQIYWEVEPVHELASYPQLIIVADWCINKMHPCNGAMVRLFASYMTLRTPKYPTNSMLPSWFYEGSTTDVA